MHGCYPVDSTFFEGSGIDAEKFIKSLKLAEDINKKVLETLKELKITHIDGLYSYRVLITLLSDVVGSDVGERILDEMGSTLHYKSGLGEPYVAKGDRTLVIGAKKQGKPMGAYRTLGSLLGFQYGYQRHKVNEWLNVSPRSQFYNEMMGRRGEAEQQVNRVLATLSDLYQQKHLLEHDIRKLNERISSFKIYDESKGEREEALKADFIDLVDIQTGRHSLLTMQSENIFPTITADFYRMKKPEDLKTGAPMGNLPESEKAMLRKKWYLYDKWKSEYQQVVAGKVKDLDMRLNSILTSIKQNEEGIRPYVRTLVELRGTSTEELDRMTDLQMMQGYSSSWRGMKLVCYKAVRENPGGGDSHYDVLVVNIDHLTLANTEQPAAPGAGGAALILKFKEYLVCKHVFDLAFKPQIDNKKGEVEKFMDLYTGKSPWIDTIKKLEPHLKTVKEFKKSAKPSKWAYAMGKADGFYVRLEELDDLRTKLVGPPHISPLYLDLKYAIGMFVTS